MLIQWSLEHGTGKKHVFRGRILDHFRTCNAMHAWQGLNKDQCPECRFRTLGFSLKLSHGERKRRCVFPRPGVRRYKAYLNTNAGKIAVSVPEDQRDQGKLHEEFVVGMTAWSEMCGVGTKSQRIHDGSKQNIALCTNAKNGNVCLTMHNGSGAKRIQGGCETNLWFGEHWQTENVCFTNQSTSGTKRIQSGSNQNLTFLQHGKNESKANPRRIQPKYKKT